MVGSLQRGCLEREPRHDFCRPRTGSACEDHILLAPAQLSTPPASRIAFGRAHKVIIRAALLSQWDLNVLWVYCYLHFQILF